MSLNPRAIATLGVGFGAVSIAYLGLWPTSITPPEPPQEIGPPRGGAYVSALDLRPGFKDDADLLELLPIIVGVIHARR